MTTSNHARLRRALAKEVPHEHLYERHRLVMTVLNESIRAQTKCSQVIPLRATFKSAGIDRQLPQILKDAEKRLKERGIMPRKNRRSISSVLSMSDAVEYLLGKM